MVSSLEGQNALVDCRTEGGLACMSYSVRFLCAFAPAEEVPQEIDFGSFSSRAVVHSETLAPFLCAVLLPSSFRTFLFEKDLQLQATRRPEQAWPF